VLGLTSILLLRTRRGAPFGPASASMSRTVIALSIDLMRPDLDTMLLGRRILSNADTLAKMKFKRVSDYEINFTMTIVARISHSVKLG
jgi:hypothetical protein